jgi:hypothetical protein
LDSIIQNSTALKSQLFRGGGTDIGDGVPSVVPASSIVANNGEANDGLINELNQKRAEISSLKGTVEDKNSIIRELESKIATLESSAGGDTKPLTDEIDSLKKSLADSEAKLKAAQENGGGDSAELETVSKERDELKERLMEYEIIEEDLANLKRLQQENEQLKKSLADAGGAAPAAAPDPTPTPEPAANDISDAPIAEEEDDFEAAMAAAIDDGGPPEEATEDVPTPPPGGNDQKSADDLLNEFEKMLG